MPDTWTMEEAKNDFTAVAEAAYAGKPQYITNSSHPDLVITTKRQDEKLKGQDKEENKRLIEFLMSCPRGDIFPDGYEPTDIPESGKEFVINYPEGREKDVMLKKPSFKELLFSIPKGESSIEVACVNPWDAK